MKKILINNFTWFVDMETFIIYEFEDKSGASFIAQDKGVTRQEREQIKQQL